jgi:hypothetical protein
MKFTTLFWLLLLLNFAFFSCKSAQSVSEKNIDAFLYQKWKVHVIETTERNSTGAEMGEPMYEFTRTGERVKSYETPPHSESIKFSLNKDSISYPDNPKLPASRISKISKDSLILSNDKAVWRLYK